MVEPGPDQLGEWAALAPATFELVEAVMSDDRSVDVLFWHKGKQYEGRAILTNTGGNYATLIGAGTPVEMET